MTELDTQAFIHTTRPAPEQFESPTNSDGLYQKPEGGLWTSTLEDDDCAWLEWCRANDWGLTDESRLYALEPESNTRVYTIDTEADLTALLEQYERTDLPAYATNSFAAPDFEALATEYDAIHLTADGQRATHFSRPGLYGWDCECTLWLSWCFESVADRGPVEATA